MPVIMAQKSIDSLFKMSSAFGREGVEFAFDAIEASVTAGTSAMGTSLEKCLAKRWPKSSISRNVSTAVQRTSKGVVGRVTLRHPKGWIPVLAQGEDIPKHTITAKKANLLFGKTPLLHIDPKTLKKGAVSKSTDNLTGDGKFLLLKSAKHPGVKGKDCLEPAQKKGVKVMIKGVARAVQKLTQKLAKAGRI